MQQTNISMQQGELLEGTAFTAEQIAHACCVKVDWVQAHVQAGVLQAELSDGNLLFGSVTLVRARRIAQLELTFDADPQLAALTTDLIEQVARLRSRLKALGVHDD